jgi:ectoine hydroxylase-related dioxygenase (phytanoyl-CoA dioxygenase family)
MLRYPTDVDGYAKPVETCDILKTMDKYGFLVIRALDQKASESSIKALWEDMNISKKLDFKNSRTWENENWPDPKNRFLSRDYATHEQSFRNRVNPNIVSAFQTLFRTDKLLTTIDYWGLKRGTSFDWGFKPHWRDAALPLHWDVDIHTYREPRTFQGLVALVDCDHDVGSFVAVPGSANTLQEWSRNHPKCKNRRVPPGDSMHQRKQKIPLRQGHMVIWDRGTAHANYGNRPTNRCRMVQYIRMIPRNMIDRENSCILNMWRGGANQNIKDNIRSWASKSERSILGLQIA